MLQSHNMDVRSTDARPTDRRWRIGAGSRSKPGSFRRRTIRLRRHQHRHLLPSQLPQPASAARPRPVLRCGVRGSRGRPGFARAAGAGPTRRARAIDRRCDRASVGATWPSTRTRRCRSPASRGWPISVPSHLQREFKRALGVSPREYQAACRAERFRARAASRARRCTARSTKPVTDRPAACTRRRRPAAAWRPRPTAAAARASTSASRPSAARSAGCSSPPRHRGVCAVKLGDSSRALEADLRREFCLRGDHTHTAASRANGSAQSWSSLSGTGHALIDLPLDVRGTAFQWRVWRALASTSRRARPARIPTSRVPSGSPSAVRAVARRLRDQSRSAWSCPAIESSPRTAGRADTGGAPVARSGCCRREGSCMPRPRGRRRQAK